MGRGRILENPKWGRGEVNIPLPAECGTLCRIYKDHVFRDFPWDIREVSDDGDERPLPVYLVILVREAK